MDGYLINHYATAVLITTTHNVLIYLNNNNNAYYWALFIHFINFNFFFFSVLVNGWLTNKQNKRNVCECSRPPSSTQLGEPSSSDQNQNHHQQQLQNQITLNTG